MKFLTLAAIAAISGAAALRSTPLESYSYEQWLIDYKPELQSFTSSEYIKRKAIFEKNLQMIKAHNQKAAFGKSSYTMDVNQFADMTEEEVMAKFTGYNFQERKASNPAYFYQGTYAKKLTKAHNVPTYVNWEESGNVPEVKNQASCGSCWAFAAATTLESHANIHSNFTFDHQISTQQLVDCTPNPRHCGGTGGCSGATAQLAFEHIAAGGVTGSDTYPYFARDGVCQFPSAKNQPLVKIGGYTNLRSNDKQELLEAIATQGPISVSVAANSFIFYSSGIFDDCTSRQDAVINHAVVAIGYDVSDDENSYLLIRNSWGKTWGVDGNIKLRLHGLNGEETCLWDKKPQDGSACEGETDPIYVCGECGVLSDSSYPTQVESQY